MTSARSINHDPRSQWWNGILRRKGTKSFHRTASMLTIVVLFSTAVGMWIWSLQLGFGELRQPGPGMWPAIVSFAMGLAVIFIVLVERTSTIEDLTRNSWRVAVGLASLGVFLVAFSWLGLTLPAFGLMFLWIWWLGKERIVQSLVISAIFTGVLYLLFRVALEVPFPPDFFVQLGSSI